VIVNIRPLKGPDGEIIGAINCFYDITERFRLERERQQQVQALADLNRRKDEFLAMLSHELRNPIAPIVNAVHLLRSQPNTDPVQERARSIIERQVLHSALHQAHLARILPTGRRPVSARQAALSR
jgi:signal transduction histidine kinase